MNARHPASQPARHPVLLETRAVRTRTTNRFGLSDRELPYTDVMPKRVLLHFAVLS